MSRKNQSSKFLLISFKEQAHVTIENGQRIQNGTKNRKNLAKQRCIGVSKEELLIDINLITF